MACERVAKAYRKSSQISPTMLVGTVRLLCRVRKYFKEPERMVYNSYNWTILTHKPLLHWAKPLIKSQICQTLSKMHNRSTTNFCNSIRLIKCRHPKEALKLRKSSKIPIQWLKSSWKSVQPHSRQLCHLRKAAWYWASSIKISPAAASHSLQTQGPTFWISLSKNTQQLW